MNGKTQGKSRLARLIELFGVFAFIGGTTFGGGYAMLPILQREIVEKRKWATEEELMDYYAIGQCTPGIIAVNTATFIGYKQFGLLGGILATLGVVTPSVVMITLIAIFLTNFAELAFVQHAFSGIRAVVCILILDSVLKLGAKSIKDKICLIIFLVVLALSVFTPVSPVWVVLLAGAAGYFLKPIADKRGDGKKGA
ncbi:MAG: chromate transporter [Oscillospiraceae bacterium]|nr:chromate transporter [Oscillospiraceae bacterium]